MPSSFDIFCRVIDNYGDIGVCWRLARQLGRTGAHTAVRLWVDDLRAFARIEPLVNPGLALQTIQGIEIRIWSEPIPDVRPHQIVIEAFACELPSGFITRMVENDSLCINLEYLSAEKWVEGCHALPSLNTNGLRKTFFFPGFTEATGGLLREPGLLQARDRWLSQPGERWALLHSLGMPADLIRGLQSGWRQVYLFCYPSAPVQALTAALHAQAMPSVIIVPEGVYPDLMRAAGGKVHVFEAPFVSQDRFDRLLWSSDLNFVRGEDSLVRALWAGKPLVWQIYEQQEDVHLAKLQAWLDLSPYPGEVGSLMLAWNTGDAQQAGLALHNALNAPNWATWRIQAESWCSKLAAAPGLAQALVAFCAKNRGKE
ncbi:elongation factor P maturation arginine rhamnosyltransferase EarP [Eoetvoesiella caeni]|uniref:Protein-arginine rhamnosyltransferase n=1 Tax=Eoetvoesiella caeni TaxID=645616 RepID=A0A366H889_9BURK|nr:elongation factor P maturation arginine rhamnosyltransferase EarP [Eoetvoesiella caeni]MCI2809961.1 elongation factor P maturation arginine rhamnosyltransferase EarP [Eoetvoesiella caeni]NYT55837.1 elongation factor P maturation arginine rhamnosyltransferase EarP [Eoetvoesiella caeni]RBP37552.1 putative repeat protein (TIGR03837 family) [Eoetvoesiella caeni]